ncbi:unnamed protein product [Prunus armeniaca]
MLNGDMDWNDIPTPDSTHYHHSSLALTPSSRIIYLHIQLSIGAAFIKSQSCLGIINSM